MENSWKQEGRGISGLWETRIWPEGPVLPRPAQRGAGPGHPPSQRLESMGVQTPARAIGGPKGPPLTAAAGPQACGDGDAELSWASSLGIQSRGALPPSWAVSPPPPQVTLWLWRYGAFPSPARHMACPWQVGMSPPHTESSLEQGRSQQLPLHRAGDIPQGVPHKQPQT